MVHQRSTQPTLHKPSLSVSSSNGNSDYNPYVSSSGISGAAGDYVATVSVNADFRVNQNGSQLQITGGVNASAGYRQSHRRKRYCGRCRHSCGSGCWYEFSRRRTTPAACHRESFQQRYSDRLSISDSTITLAGLTVTDAGPFGLNGFASSDLFAALAPHAQLRTPLKESMLTTSSSASPNVVEMATSSSVDSAFIADPTPNLTSPAQPITRTQVGSYQLKL